MRFCILWTGECFVLRGASAKDFLCDNIELATHRDPYTVLPTAAAVTLWQGHRGGKMLLYQPQTCVLCMGSGEVI